MIVAKGEHEGVKSAIHGALGAFAAVCFTYNLGVVLSPRRRHGTAAPGTEEGRDQDHSQYQNEHVQERAHASARRVGKDRQ